MIKYIAIGLLLIVSMIVTLSFISKFNEDFELSEKKFELEWQQFHVKHSAGEEKEWRQEQIDRLRLDISETEKKKQAAKKSLEGFKLKLDEAIKQ